MPNSKDEIIVKLQGYGLDNEAKSRIEAAVIRLLKQEIAQVNQGLDSQVSLTGPGVIGIRPKHS